MVQKGITFFPKIFHRDEPNSTRNYRKSHSNGKCVSVDTLLSQVAKWLILGIGAMNAADVTFTIE